MTALLCPGRGTDEARDVFFQIYPHAECLGMASTFVRAYREAARVPADCAAAAACA